MDMIFRFSSLKLLKNSLKISDAKPKNFFFLMTCVIIFFSSEDYNDEVRVMHSKKDNIEIMISDEADEVIKKLFDSLKNRYQNNLESMRGSEFVFNYVQLLYYKFHKINLNRG